MKPVFRITFVLVLTPILSVYAGLTATNIAAGSAANHSLFIKSDGSLWAMGINSEGQLGNGNLNSTNRPAQIVPDGVVAAAAGDLHSLYLKSDGSLWSMGYNYYGQLGDGTALFATNKPEEIYPGGVTNIAAGYSLRHSHTGANLPLAAAGFDMHHLVRDQPPDQRHNWIRWKSKFAGHHQHCAAGEPVDSSSNQSYHRPRHQQSLRHVDQCSEFEQRAVLSIAIPVIK
jgi:hypothetical protein